MAPSEQALAELRDAHRKGIVLGLQGVSKTVERLDIDILLTKYPKTFNLFVLALDKLQHETPTTDKMSYFQIAGKSPVSKAHLHVDSTWFYSSGIHGLPRSLWDGVGGKTNAADRRQWVGYCAHGQPTFPSWHRPYMALMEVQVLELPHLFILLIRLASIVSENDGDCRELCSSSQSFL